MADDFTLDSPVVQAISRVPDQRIQNMVMEHFDHYQEEVMNMLYMEGDRTRFLAQLLETIQNIAESAIQNGDTNPEFDEIIKITLQRKVME